jgi:enoyl-CoA hydratase/carnithine racemase
MSDDAPVQLEVRNSVLIITLDRPDALNAHNQAMRDHLVDALDRLDGDDELLVGVVRGAGRAFSAGADLKELRGSGSNRPDVDRATRMRPFYRLDATRKPLIAVVHGWTIAGGLELALCCDIRVAAADAKFALPEPRSVGVMPGVAVLRLAQMIPQGEALRLLLTSRPIDAARAHAIGLVQEVAADADAALDVALELAAQIAECDAGAVANAKQIARWPLNRDVAMSGRFAVEVGAFGAFGTQQFGPTPSP